MKWTLGFVTLTFMMYIYIGWRSRVRETRGFYVAGQGVPALANGAATAADWMSAASFIGMAGLISFNGSDGSVYLMGWTGGYVLLALLLAPYLRKFGKYTVPDFVGERYYSETARVVAAICAIFVSMTYIAGQMRGVGIVFSRFLEVPIWQGVLIGMVIVAFFAVLGGMKGITWTQVVQYFVLIFAFLIPAIAIAYSFTGGNPVPQSAMTYSDISERLNNIQTDLGFREYTEPFANMSMLNVFCLTFALMAGTAGLPHVIVRFYTVPNVRAARYSAGWALLFIAILYTTAPALAMFARHNMLDNLHDASIQQIDIVITEGAEETKTSFPIAAATPEQRQIAYGKIEEAQKRAKEDAKNKLERKTAFHFELLDKKGQPIVWTNKWQSIDLIVFNDKNEDGRIQMNSVIDEKTGKPTKKFTEATIDADTIVLLTPEMFKLAPWVIALVATGALAAALSTAAGLLLVISSSMAHDLYIHFFDPKASEAKRVMVGRIVIVLAIFVAGYFGINPPGFVAEIVAFAFGLAAASFFPVILLGIFYKRATRQGAIAGMLVGLLFTGFYILGCKADKILPFAAEPFFEPWFFGISPQGIGTVGCILNLIVTLVVSHLTPPPPKHIQELVESVRVPVASREPEAKFDETDAEADNP
ncbi:MAG: cation acetate symporter [Planctomycetes bacterium]|nr:cation acetate symporter [Planctomycetota bacterium]